MKRYCIVLLYLVFYNVNIFSQIDFNIENTDRYVPFLRTNFSKQNCEKPFGDLPGDDGYFIDTLKGFQINFLGDKYPEDVSEELHLYVNVNGSVSLSKPMCSYNPDDIETIDEPAICAYWSDIYWSDCDKDNKEIGIFKKHIRDNDGNILAVKYLWKQLHPFRIDDVGDNDHRVTFQITILNNKHYKSGDNIYLCYGQLGFTRGSATTETISNYKSIDKYFGYLPATVGIRSKNSFLSIGRFDRKDTENNDNPTKQMLSDGTYPETGDSMFTFDDVRLLENNCFSYDLHKPIVVTPSQTCKDGFFTIEVFKSISEICTLIYDRGEIGEDRDTIKTSQCEFKYPADGEEHTIVVLKDNETLYEGKINAPKCTSCSAEDWSLNINGEDLAASYCSNKVLSFSAKPKSGVELTNPKYTWSFSNSESSDMTTPEKTYTVARKESVSVKITSDECKEGITLGHEFSIDICPVDEVCPTEFAPTVGKKYILSGWMHVDGANNEISFEDYGSIKVEYEGSEQVDEGIPSGDIIDGWQRIYKEVLIPEKATRLNFELVSKKDNDCYFDDIRFHPVDASMVSYVYDPVTLRLVAELDNENYATFYEYDEEGAMIRVKKETERGIMTIKEARQGGVKTK